MKTAILLIGPEAVGKTAVARVLQAEIGAHHVDVDRLVLDLVAEGVAPDPDQGWSAYVLTAVIRALDQHDLVVFETTGAYPSDWRAAETLEQTGARLVRIWLQTDLDTSLRRLRARQEPQAPISESEAERIYRQATQHAAVRRFDLTIDTTAPLDQTAVADAVRALVASPRPAS